MARKLPQPNQPAYDLDVVAKFPVYRSREAYAQANGVVPPPYDYNKPIKRWLDPDALGMDPEDSISYEMAYRSGGGFVADAQGFVRPQPFTMTAEEAASLNIPPDTGTSHSLNLMEGRVPIELLPNERLWRQPFGGNLVVKRLDYVAPGSSFGHLSDRELLEAIAATVGVKGK